MGNKGGKEKISQEARAKAAEVMKLFIEGYPGVPENPLLTRNADFYLRDLGYEYSGQKYTIGYILRKLQADPAALYTKEAVWWPTFVFPTRDPFPVSKDQAMHPLQLHEVKAITSNASSFLVYRQLLQAFLLSWGFYCDVLGPSPRIELHKDTYSRYADRATSDLATPRNITRVLKSMGEFGLENMKPQFVLALIIATYRGEKKWLSLRESLVLYWAPCLRSTKAREGAVSLIRRFEEHVDGKAPAPSLIVDWANAEVDDDVVGMQPYAAGASKAFFSTHDFRVESQLGTAGEAQPAKPAAPMVNGVKGGGQVTVSSTSNQPPPTSMIEDESGIVDESPAPARGRSGTVAPSNNNATVNAAPATSTATAAAVPLPPGVDRSRAPPALTGAYVAPLPDGVQKIYFDFPTTHVAARVPTQLLKQCTMVVLPGSFASHIEASMVNAVRQLAAETGASVDVTSNTLSTAITAATRAGTRTLLYFVPPDVVVNAIALQLRQRIADERKELPKSELSVCAVSPAFLGAALRAPPLNVIGLLREYVVVRDPLPDPLSRVVPLVVG